MVKQQSVLKKMVIKSNLLWKKTGASAAGSIKFTGGYCHLQRVNYICAMKILMVCLGNICRSPLAEGILQKKVKAAGLHWYVDSAGTNGYHTGEAPHRLSQKVSLHNGIDISKQVSRNFVKEDFDRFDLIYAMAADVIDDIKRIAGNKFDASKVDLLLNGIYPGENRDVPDPWYGTEPGYHKVFELIDRACDALIQQHGSEIQQYQPSNIKP